MASVGTIARRGFLIGSVAVLGGVAFGVYAISRPAPNPLKPGEGEAVLNPFVVVARDGITLIAPRAEMGQGVRTTWAALIAEEMDVELDQVRVIHGPAAKAYFNSVLLGGALPDRGYDRGGFGDWLGERLAAVSRALKVQVTGGSTSMRDGFERMRAAGASARETLKQAAAVKYGIKRERLRTERGRVILPDGTALAYTELAAVAALVQPIDALVREPSRWRLLGRSLPRLDMVAKATGTARFGIDVRLPGMRFASCRMSPVPGGTVAGFDAGAALAMPGVERVVDLGDGVAVVAANTWLAMQALERLRIAWKRPADAPGTADLFARIRAAFDGPPNSTLRDDGDADTPPAGAQVIEAEYEVPYLAHATMEPMNATAHFTGDRLVLWAGTQAPTFLAMKAAAAVGLDADEVEVHTTYLGGGYGRRAEFDFGVIAARVAREMPGVPVQLTWSREEDMTHDMYRPGAVARMRGAVRDGRAVLLDGRIAAQSPTRGMLGRLLGMAGAGPDKGHVEGAFDQPYAIPAFRIRGYLADLPVPVGFWRSVASSFNAFFMESFIDELAHAAGRDPLEFRLGMARAEWAPAAKVLEAVAEMSGWDGRSREGVGRGVAMSYSFGTPVAEVIEVVREDAGIRIARAWIAADLGLALDPGIVRAQMFGGMVYGLSAACFGEITFAGGAAEQRNFPDYEALRMHTMPRVEVRVLENQARMGGAGEPGTPPAAPALANALFDLTGRRARRLPLMHDFDLLS